MNFINQPPELIVDQLAQLSPEELVNVCRTNTVLAEICADRHLWTVKLQRDFQVEDLSRIENPRDHYLQLLEDRQKLLDHLLNTVTPEEFQDHQAIFSRNFNMVSYDEFVKVQQEAVGQLTEEQIQNTGALLRMMFREELSYFSERLMIPWAVFFTRYGDLVLL